ncbi:hypothetical protein GW17_00053137 [Ensete ventricosum]|nr:hypothetical protein GW17_00053137 [Ensete ventricosum]
MTRFRWRKLIWREKGRRIWLKCTMLGDSDEDVDGVEREGEDEVDDDGKMKMGTGMGMGKKIRKMMVSLDAQED